MTRSLSKLLVLLLLTAVLAPVDRAPADDFKVEDGYTSLFNGKDLTGWEYGAVPPVKNPPPKEKLEGKTTTSDGVFLVQDGLLVATGKKVRALYTAREYNQDFRLKFEFRTVADKPKNNSGLFIRGPQLQLDATNQGGLTGVFRNVKNFKLGDWNEIDVTVRGTEADCLCNGEAINKKPMKIPATGTIGLQSEYGQFEFRRIRIAELPKKTEGNENRADAVGRALFNGKDLAGWKLRHPATEKRGSKWSVVSAVKLKEGMPRQLEAARGTGVLLNGDDGRGIDLLSEKEHGDCELHIEFVVPQGSNSGVYFQGQYEVQILDSFGKKDAELKYGDCGGIYNTAPPRTNVSRAPGEWQSFDVVFQAPRFQDGKKTANAQFLKVIHNGTVIHENVEVKGPTTAALGGAEKPFGPLMLQGDHGPVAFRNIRLKLLAGK